jgi:S1-C subfamily serine protease
LRRGRHFHRRVFLVAHLVAVFAGGAAAVVGALHWYGISGALSMRHLTMPAFTAGGYQSVHFERIAAATAVIVAPDQDGDARSPGVGTGAIIGRDRDRAWIVTCSHVAMPYAAVASWRDPGAAMPVWVQLHDGRSARGTITWAAPPPLDVALVEVRIANPPAPIEISRATDTLETGAPVMFVPNPYREGWMIHHGEIEKRRMHRTPAGPYSLLYTTLPVQPGDSGSGLFDSRGMLIGLNTWARFDAGGSRGISLPSETLQALVDAVRENRLHDLSRILPAQPEQPQQQ